MTVTAHVGNELFDKGLAFQHMGDYDKTKGWLDQSVTWVIPTRGFYHAKVVDSWDSVNWPMNQVRTGRLTAIGMEVAEAYNFLFRLCIDEDFCNKYYNPQYSQIITGTRFVLTTEEDNILPPNTITGLMAAIYTCPDCSPASEIVDYENWTCANGHHGFDVMSGLYFTKTIPPQPMAYGNPENGPDDFKPQSVTEAVKHGATIAVNGTGMGVAIFRKAIFEKLSQPWFETVAGDSQTGSGSHTQDLGFARKAAAELGARFGVCCGVKAGHMDYKTGQVY